MNSTRRRIPLVLVLTLLSVTFNCGTSYVPTSSRAGVRFHAPCLNPTLDGGNDNSILSFLAIKRSSAIYDPRAKRRTRVDEFILMESPNLSSDGDDTPEEGNLESDLTEDDWTLLSTILAQSKQTIGENGSESDLSDAIERILIANLPQMPPRLTLKLRKAADGIYDSEDSDRPLPHERRTQLRTVGTVLVRVLDEGLRSGSELLSTLLEAGEVRKLDGAIGRALKEGRLDMAFFTVMNMNLADAAEEEKERVADLAADAEANGERPPPTEVGAVSRYQILQHIYTRCQEEVEKSVDPAAGLLNKLLRTEVDSIRQNQLKHYLVPEVNTVTAADGSEIVLPGAKALVPPEDLLKALADAVRQVRTVERAGGTDRETAAGLVESCRQLAIEARLVIGKGYGPENEVFLNFERGLQPVFRPQSADSEYIKGSG